jgi:hypothetical protein
LADEHTTQQNRTKRKKKKIMGWMEGRERKRERERKGNPSKEFQKLVSVEGLGVRQDYFRNGSE